MLAHIFICKYDRKHFSLLRRMQTDTYVFSVFAVLASICMRTYALFKRVQTLSYVSPCFSNTCKRVHMCFRPFSMLAYIDVCAYDISCFFKETTSAKICRRRKNRLFSLKMRRIIIGLSDSVRHTSLLSHLRSLRDARQVRAFRRG